MTIAITCNLSDGVILGVDSAISVEGAIEMPGGEQQKGILKVYKTAEKLFKLSPHVGIVTFGLGMLGARSIGSYIAEFELQNRETIGLTKPLSEICDSLLSFFSDKYVETLRAPLENQHKMKFEAIPDKLKPSLGFQVAGYSEEAPLSEVWLLNVPKTKDRNDKVNLRPPGQFGSNWSGMFDPVTRLIKGFDRKLLNAVVDFFVKKCNLEWNQNLSQEMDQLVQRFEGRILYDAMPLQEGIDHVKYLLDVVIHNTRFVIGAPICDAPIRIAVITRDEKGFRFINEPKFTINI